MFFFQFYLVFSGISAGFPEFPSGPGGCIPGSLRTGQNAGEKALDGVGSGMGVELGGVPH